MGPDGGGAAIGAVALSRLIGILALALTSTLVAVACGSSTEDGVTGIVVDVQGELDDVEQFTVLVDGERMVLETTPEADYAFPVAHLREHLRSGAPVLVRWEEQGDRRIATFIDDA